MAELKNSGECIDYLKLMGGVHSSSIEDANELEQQNETIEKKRGKLCKLISLNKSTDQNDEDEEVFNEVVAPKSEDVIVKKNVKFEKSMSLDMIDFSNQTDLAKDEAKKNTSENLILAIKPKSGRKEQSKKALRIFRDRSAQTLPIYQEPEQTPNDTPHDQNNNDKEEE